VVFINKNKTMPNHLTLKEFKDNLNKPNATSKVDFTSLGGNDSEQYGLLLDGIDYYLTNHKYENIKLSDLKKIRDIVSINITNTAGNLNHADNLIDNMIKLYGTSNKAKKISTNTLEMTLESISSNSQNTESRKQAIANALWKKTTFFTNPSIKTGTKDLQPLAVAESNEIDSNLILEEINRIKEIMSNG
jgi:hypothetical protein